MDELEGLLDTAFEKFRVKIEEDKDLKDELADITRSVHVDVIDEEGFSFLLENGDVNDFKRGMGAIAEPDIKITATKDDFKALFSGELKPMKAWATKRLKVKASISDLMKIKKMF